MRRVRRSRGRRQQAPLEPKGVGSSVSTEIILNVEGLETRAAILEDGRLVEIHHERTVSQRFAGNIYLGRVANVLPGMQAAFVNIGLDRNAFLYIDDVSPAQAGHHVDGETERSAGSVNRKSISKLLTPGQELLVQVAKEPIGTKGARVTTNITLPGRYLVLMPTADYVGVSRRIESEDERSRLRELANGLSRDGMGVIVRTVAEGRSVDDLQQDLDFLRGVWDKIRSKSRKANPPSLLHREYDLVYRVARDYLDEKVDRLTIDDAEEYRRTLDFVASVMPSFREKVHHYGGKDPILEDHGVEPELARALKRKVWLDCGGYIVVDSTEALVSIDVNTGKFTGSTSLAETVFRTNMDAAVEIARQLRLRNIGGIVVIDFIDMDRQEDRNRVLARLKEELSKDRTKSNVIGFTGLGLVEMTRKKVRQSLDDFMTKTCPYCEGKGKVPSEVTTAIAAERDIAAAARTYRGRPLLVEANPAIAALLIGSGGQNLERLERDLGVPLYIKGQPNADMTQVTVTPLDDESIAEALLAPVSPGQQLDVIIEDRHVGIECDGIARVDGYVLDVAGAGDRIGDRVRVEVTKVYRTYARACIVS